MIRDRNTGGIEQHVYELNEAMLTRHYITIIQAYEVWRAEFAILRYKCQYQPRQFQTTLFHLAELILARGQRPKVRVIMV
jgi:hypothetical protein